MKPTISFIALALLLVLSSVGLNARSADAASRSNAEAPRSAIQADMLQALNDHRYSVGAPTIGLIVATVALLIIITDFAIDCFNEFAETVPPVVKQSFHKAGPIRFAWPGTTRL